MQLLSTCSTNLSGAFLGPQVRVFQHMVGYDVGDAQTGLVANRTLPINYTQFLTVDGLRGARLGVVRSITNVTFADAEVMALYDGAISELEQQGAPYSRAQPTATDSGKNCVHMNWTRKRSITFVRKPLVLCQLHLGAARVCGRIVVWSRHSACRRHGSDATCAAGTHVCQR